jgi:hypothetical protein
MASFAKLNSDNVVIKVESVANAVLQDANGVEQESLGVEFLRNLYKEPNGNWKQTSYNTIGGVHKLGGTPFRQNFAGIGMIYYEANDVFITPKPFNSWTLNTNTYTWEAPVAYPETYNQGLMDIDDITPKKDLYNWNEQTLSWDLIS